MWLWDRDDIDGDLTGPEAQAASDRDMMAVTGAASPADAWAMIHDNIQGTHEHEANEATNQNQSHASHENDD